ncbi:MAG: IS91 family transposase [Verrucomicrobiota bacterium]
MLRLAMPAYAAKYRLPVHHWKTLRAIMVCRTAALGGHHYECRHCGAEHFVPHSCRNRHCPTCHAANSADWLAKQAEVLLPIPYFHLVFTLPHDLNPLIQQNQAAIYNLLFGTASATLLEFGRNNLHAQIGVTAVLHTWSQTLMDHYHLHCIVTGGGLCADGSWKSVKPHWLFPVRALSLVFRAKFRDGLEALFNDGKLEFHGQIGSLANGHRFRQLLRSVCRPKWVVYAKRPFPGAKAVLAYLSRYTHRVGISNQRLKALDRERRTVTFDFKDYADDSRRKLMTLNLEEFVRRLRLHLLPARFVKIRHFGLLSNRNRHNRIVQARSALKMESVAAPSSADGILPEASNSPEPVCPKCRRPGLRLVRVTRHDSFRTCPIFSDSS